MSETWDCHLYAPKEKTETLAKQALDNYLNRLSTVIHDGLFGKDPSQTH